MRKMTFATGAELAGSRTAKRPRSGDGGADFVVGGVERSGAEAAAKLEAPSSLRRPVPSRYHGLT